MTPYKLKVVTPDKLFFDGETEQIIAKTTEGNVGILANHADYISNLPEGALKIMVDGTFKVAAISGGLLNVSPTLVTILATSAEWEENIDVARAKIAEEKAMRILKSQTSGAEFENAKL